jgi:hypothetical protein
VFQGSERNDFNDLEMNQVCYFLTSFVCLFVHFLQIQQVPARRWSIPARCSISTQNTTASSLSCYNIGIGRRWNTGVSWVEEGKEGGTLEEVKEKEWEEDNKDARDKDLNEEEKKRDQEMTRIGCYCFSGVSVTISS